MGAPSGVVSTFVGVFRDNFCADHDLRFILQAIYQEEVDKCKFSKLHGNAVHRSCYQSSPVIFSSFSVDLLVSMKICSFWVAKGVVYDR